MILKPNTTNSETLFLDFNKRNDKVKQYKIHNQCLKKLSKNFQIY